MEAPTMKKFTALLAGAALLMAAGSSWAVPWEDTSDSGHDRYAGQVNSGEAAFARQPGLNADGTYDFSYTSETFDRSFSGLMEQNSHLKHDGDSRHDYSQHTDHGIDTDQVRDAAIGRDTAPVPEPGTVALLGFGLIGLAIFGKYRINDLKAC
jgi:hypothetical protein